MAINRSTRFFSLALLIVGALILIGASAFGQEQKSDNVIRIQSELVSFEVSARDAHGLPLLGLKPEDFIVLDDGHRQKVAHLEALESPFDLVLLIDTSISTEQEMDLMRAAARNFVGEIGDQDRVAIVHFSRDVELLSDFTSDRARLKRAVERVGNANLRMGSSVYDALSLAIGNELLGARHGRKAVLMLSDGVDSSSILNYEAIKPLLERANAGIYFIDLDTEKFTEDGVVRDRADPQRLTFSQAQLLKYYRAFGASRHLDPIRYTNHWLLTPVERKEVNHGLYALAGQELYELADRTGGEVFPAKSIQDLETAYRAVIDELRSLYSIGYYPSRAEPDGKWHQISVEVRSPGAKVRHRSGYWSSLPAR